MNNHISPDQWIVIWIIWIIFGGSVVLCCIAAWWKIRVWRKLYQLTDPKVKGIPISLTRPSQKGDPKKRIEPHF